MKLHLLDDVILNFNFFTPFHTSGTRPNFSKSYHLFTNQNKIIKNRVQKIGGIPLTRRGKKNTEHTVSKRSNWHEIRWLKNGFSRFHTKSSVKLIREKTNADYVDWKNMSKYLFGRQSNQQVKTKAQQQ